MTQQDKATLIALLNQYGDLRISEQIDFQKFYLYSIIAHSTAIEGSTVTALVRSGTHTVGGARQNRPLGIAPAIGNTDL